MQGMGAGGMKLGGQKGDFLQEEERLFLACHCLSRLGCVRGFQTAYSSNEWAASFQQQECQWASVSLPVKWE